MAKELTPNQKGSRMAASMFERDVSLLFSDNYYIRRGKRRGKGKGKSFRSKVTRK